MAICIYTYIYVTSSRLIGWKFCCNSTFLFPHMDTHSIHFFALDENIPYNRRSFSRYYSCMAPYAPSTYSTCLISLARVISILLKKKKKSPLLAQINRPTILLSCTSNVRICLSVCLLSLFFFLYKYRVHRRILQNVIIYI